MVRWRTFLLVPLLTLTWIIGSRHTVNGIANLARKPDPFRNLPRFEAFRDDLRGVRVAGFISNASPLADRKRNVFSAEYVLAPTTMQPELQQSYDIPVTAEKLQAYDYWLCECDDAFLNAILTEMRANDNARDIDFSIVEKYQGLTLVRKRE